MKSFIVLVFLIHSFAWSQTKGVDEVQELLDLDRFHDYTQNWAQTMSGRGKKDISKVILKMTASDFSSLKLDKAKLADAFYYDELILTTLNKSHPHLKATKENVAWGYNFYKRKLNDSYKVLSPANVSNPKAAPVVSPGKSNGLAVNILPANSDEVLLDVDSYVSNRTTRAVFWEASKNKRKIELHVGSPGDFKSDMAQRGAKIIGEVRTHARNYNPIYIIQDPGEKSFHYAVTEIAGGDRLKHFQMQSSLVRWEQGKGKLAPPPPIEIVGDAVAKLKAEEATLTQILKVVPKADRVLIGQKGAFERTVGSLGKINAILDLAKKHPEEVKIVFSANHLKLLEKAKESSKDLTEFVMKYDSPLDKMYEAAKPVLTKHNIAHVPLHTVYSLDRGSYEVSDYMLQGAGGKVQRWRVFSNVWGDEVLPVAEALKSTGHKDVVYIGTAGALPNSGLEVGDLVIPQKSHDVHGDIRKLDNKYYPPGSKKIDVVTHVSSPFEETHDWLKDRNKFAQAVEVETGYLAKVFNASDDRMSIMLLVSDLVGVEGETLADASSSARRNAQIDALSSVIDEAGVTRPVAASMTDDKLSAWIEELAPTKDPLAKFQAFKEAEARRISSKEDMAKFLTVEKSFTTKRLLTSIDEAEVRLARLLDIVVEEGTRPSISLPKSFIEGRWNPAKEPISVHLKVSNPEIEKELRKIIEDLVKEDQNFTKFLKISLSQDHAGKDWINLPGFLDSPDGTLLNLYKDSALGFGGLATTETRTGNLKFVQVAPPVKGKAVTTLAYFSPDEETEKLLQSFTKGEDLLAQRLESKMKEINEKHGKKFNFKVRLKKVSKLDKDALASITPELGKKELIINVNMTEKGLANPAVILEELIHLEQITGGKDDLGRGYKYAFFGHPYEWAETVANAKAGSPRAMEMMARMELEAIKAARDIFAETKETSKDVFGVNYAHIKKYQKARESHAEKIYKDVSKLAKADLRKREAAWKKMRDVFDQMEKEPIKFNDLVANNDRKGARKMLETYLPWDIMEPSEKNSWEKWLDAMENPDKNNLKLVFRGMDDDTVIKSPTGKPGVFSTVLTRNQGSYTRRLRSLTTLRDRFGVYRNEFKVHPISGISNSPSLMTIMSNHADSPQGSPFISVSNHEVSIAFGGQKRGAMLIDERRLVPNAMAFGFANERELLIPLVVFPEEVIHYVDYTKEKGDDYYNFDEKKFLKDIEEKLGRPIEKFERYKTKNDKHFVQTGYERIKELLLEPENLPKTACSIDLKGCDCVFETLNALLK